MPTIIGIDDITQVSLTGNGYFDKLMRTVSLHVKREFSEGRINTSDYSMVYLKALESAMQQSIAFSLNKDKAEADADLTAEKIAQIACETAKCQAEILQVNAQTALIHENTAKTVIEGQLLQKELPIKDKELLLMDQKIVGMQKQNQLTDKQIEKLAKDIIKADSEIAVMQQEVLLMVGKVRKMEADADVAEKSLLLMDKELLIKAQELLIKQQQLQQMIHEVAKTAAEVTLLGAQTQKTLKDVELMQAQINDMVARHATIVHEIVKMQAEAQFTVAKKNVEVQRLGLMVKELTKADKQIVLLDDNHTMNLLAQAGKVIENLLLQSKKNNEDQRLFLLIKQTNAEGIKYLGGANPNSIMGAQMRLLKNQGTSYKAKMYETKAKIYSEMFSVSRTQDDAAGNIKALIAKPVVDDIDTAINLFV